LICAPTRPGESADWLEQYLKRQGGNAVAWYLLAEQQLRHAETLAGTERELFWERALASIESANRAPAYQVVQIAIPAPVELRRAWSFQRPYGLGDDRRVHMFLFSPLRDISKNCKEKGDCAGLIRLFDAEVAMTFKTL